MANVTIRNVNDAVIKALKARAKKNNRSLEAELRQVLADSVSGTRGSDLRALAKRIASLTPTPARPAPRAGARPAQSAGARPAQSAGARPAPKPEPGR